MTKDELNKWAAEFMGMCAHEFDGVDERPVIQRSYWECEKCGIKVYTFPGNWNGVKDYCSDDSPRSLVDGLEAKIPWRLTSGYYDRLANIVLNTRMKKRACPREAIHFRIATTPAHQRVRAVYETMKDVQVEKGG